MSRDHTLKKIRESVTVHGVARAEIGADRSAVITSVGTGRITEQAERRFMEWRRTNGLRLDGPYLKAEADEFLTEYAETHGQSSTDSTRLGLSRLLGLRFTHVPSLIETVLEGRAITWDEVRQIIKHQREWNALSTLASLDAGLRAHELATLRREDELEPSQHRNWTPTMFLGRKNYVRMVTTGKGGLRRPVALSSPIAEAIEARRMSAAEKRTDRGVHREPIFDLGSGQRLSQSFSYASLTALGYSLGYHSLRHGFAQRRVGELVTLGYDFMTAVQMVSVELGHFRPVLAYYQPR
ncbi:tyrosine-type recombinase/integrase [Paraburkholderia mimosarum]|uniref:tyrosine-type recombinase/integrase n=1 Tax=Paraburkholderia mimosarum TaxID=312026 RepID=UPI0039C0A567